MLQTLSSDQTGSHNQSTPIDSIRSARFRKLLLLAPLPVFSLVTLLLLSSGVLAPYPASGLSSSDGRLNSHLPNAVLPSDSDWTKLTYYLKADRESKKRTEARKRDPYYGLRMVDTGFSLDQSRGTDDPDASRPSAGRVSAVVSGMVRDLPGKRRTGSSVPARQSASVSSAAAPLAEDPQVREVYRKLNSLQRALDQASMSTPASVSTSTSASTSSSAFSSASPYARALAPTSREASVAELPGSTGTSGILSPAPVEGTGLSGAVPRENSAGDPEMTQIAEIMDKILAVQHPELITDSLRRAAERRQAEAYAVSGVPSGTIGRMAPIGASEAPRVSAAPGAPDLARRARGRFYTLGAGVSEGGEGTTLKAMVPETQTLTNGTRVKLELSEDMFVKGGRIPGGTLLYGTSRFSTERMMVNITSLVSNGQIIPVALSVYDLDGLEGIHIPVTGARQSVKSSGARAVESIGIGTLDPSIGAQAAGAGIQAVRSLVGKKIRKVQVTLRAGYQLLLKNQGGQ